MVHCNNCTTDINAYAGIFLSFAKAAGIKTDLGGIFSLLFRLADEGKPDCSGLCSVGYPFGRAHNRNNERSSDICRKSGNTA